MEKSDIRKMIREKSLVGTVFTNPGGGTSTIVKITEDKITYIRGKSRFSLPIDAFINVCSTYNGKKCSTSDLKKHCPKVFDPKENGHGCNCTFLFCLAKELGLAEGEILGKGVSGCTYYIFFKD